MSFKATVYNVMISCPSDVQDEKKAIIKVLHKYNSLYSNEYKIILLHRMWKNISYSIQNGCRSQETANQTALIDSDLLIGIFWTKIGTATGKSESSTIEEIEMHIESKKPALLYFSSKPVMSDSIDSSQYKKLKHFKNKMREKRLYFEYDNISDFESALSQHLINLIQNDKYFKTSNTSLPNNYPTTEDVKIELNLTKMAKFFLKQASESRRGKIVVSKELGSLIYKCDDCYEATNRREEADWVEAIDLLESSGLLEAKGNEREIFYVTAKGYTVADSLPDYSPTE